MVVETNEYRVTNVSGPDYQGVLLQDHALAARDWACFRGAFDRRGVGCCEGRDERQDEEEVAQGMGPAVGVEC